MSKIYVNKCKYYEEKYCSMNKHAYVYCCQKDNCYYKQLQQLKEDYAELLNRHNASFDNFQQLKAENESLKSLNDFNVQKIETLETENEKLKEKIIISKEMLQFDIEQTNIYPLKII